MKLFISSTIRDFATYRDAVARAGKTLRHVVKRAEDFGASPGSPQQVCLAGVRDSDVVVLILGAAYGDAPNGKLSPTHEEYREAREHGDVLVFIQDGVTREPRQDEFVREVQAWSKGHYTGSFSTPEELQDGVIGALHELEISRKTGIVDEKEMLKRARDLASDSRSFGSSSTLAVIVTGAPPQQVVRPVQLESAELADVILKEAMFGPNRVFDRHESSEARVAEGHLVIEQRSASVQLSPLGDIRIVQPAEGSRPKENYLSFIVEEELTETIERCFHFAAWLLDEIDSNRRLVKVAPIAVLVGGGHLGWLKRAEAARRPNSMTMGMGGNDPTVVHLTPAACARASLGHDAKAMAEDLMVLLRRERKP